MYIHGSYANQGITVYFTPLKGRITQRWVFSLLQTFGIDGTAEEWILIIDLFERITNS